MATDCSCYDCNFVCHCSYCLSFRQNFQATSSPYLLYNPTCGTTYTYDLRNHECLYPESGYCCPIFYTVSGRSTIVIPRPLYGVPRGIGPHAGGPPHAPHCPHAAPHGQHGPHAAHPHAPPHVPPYAPPHAPPHAPRPASHEQHGRDFHGSHGTHPLFRPVASTIPGFTAFGRKTAA